MRALLATLALAALAASGCAAPPDALWHETLEARVTSWEFNDAELKVQGEVEAPSELPAQATLELTARFDLLTVADQPCDLGRGQLSHVLEADGRTRFEFRTRLLNPTVIPEEVLSGAADLALTFRGQPRLAARAGWVGAQAQTWRPEQLPGVEVQLERWDAEGLVLSVQGAEAGALEVGVRGPEGQPLRVEELRVGTLVRLAFTQPCPAGAELVLAWRAERRCRARLEVQGLVSQSP